MIKRQLDLGIETNETCPISEESADVEQGEDGDEVCIPNLGKVINH